MAYHIDAERVSLNDLQKRIQETDLVPSRTPLLDEIDAKMKLLERHGITTLGDLRKDLKTAKRREALAEATGIDKQYLVLLRREINGYFPKPPALQDFDWLPQTEIAKLEQKGIRKAAALYEAAGDAASIMELAESVGIDIAVLEALVRLVALTRIRWVSPMAARMLVEAGYDSVSHVAAADAQDLYEDLRRVNAGDRFFKGNIGLRDIKRLVQTAGYVSE